jgi:hypothetical protein
MLKFIAEGGNTMDKDTKKLSKIRRRGDKLYHQGKVNHDQKKIDKARDQYAVVDTALELKRIEASREINNSKSVTFNTNINSKNNTQKKSTWFSNNKAKTKITRH